MNKRQLGRTGLLVSEISFGAVEIGLPYGIPVDGVVQKPDEREAHQLLNAALDMGINFIDTARAYGDSEEIIGRALTSRRQEYLLATKTMHFADKGLTPAEQKNAVLESVEISLRMLQTDFIDVLQVHNLTRQVIDAGVVPETLEELRAAGKARFLGATVYGTDDPLAVIEDGRFDVIQVAYNMLDRRLEERVLPLAAEKGVAVTVRSVLLKGALTPRYQYLPDSLGELKALVGRLEDLTQSEAGSLPEAAFRYVLANPHVSSALVGTGKLHNLQRSADYAAMGPLSERLIAEVRDVVVRNTNLVNPATWEFQERYQGKS